MKALISILVVVVVCLGAWKLLEHWQGISDAPEAQQPVSQQVDPAQLEGMPYQLEPSLQKASEGGAKTMREWIETYKRNQVLKDPRLAWIELDYVLMLARENPLEAKRVFADVQSRIGTNSPVYPRVRQLAKTFE